MTPLKADAPVRSSAPPPDAVLIRRIGAAVALVLLVLAVCWAAMRTDALLVIAREPNPLLFGLLAAAVVANIVFTGLIFHHLTRGYGSVGLLEMQALIASTALMNLLPFRPGFFGRLAYHKTINRIRVRDSLAIYIRAMALSAMIVFLLVGGLAVSHVLELDTIWGVLWPLPVLLGLITLGRSRYWGIALILRYADVLAWVARYWIAFRLIGVPVDLLEATAFAVIGVFIGLIPLLTVGVREWAIGLATPLLSEGTLLAVGVSADLVNRGVEVIVIVLAGCLGGWYLSRTTPQSRQEATPSVPAPAPEPGPPSANP